MSEFLQSLRSDLLSRRLLPLAALALLALAVAVGYALGGGSSAAPPQASATPGAGSQPASLPVAAAAPNPNSAESETPGGVRYQTGGPTRNPFKPLPESKASAASKPSGAASTGSPGSKTSAGGATGSGGASGSSKSGGAGSAGGTGKSGGSGKPAQPGPAAPKSSNPNKKAFQYDVSVLFGRLPAAGQEATLPPFQGLRLGQSLPSARDARIQFERVGGNAQSAVFALLEPAILRGQGACVPSESECEALALAPGHAEELEYVEENGHALVYELKTVSIVKRSSQAAG